MANVNRSELGSVDNILDRGSPGFKRRRKCNGNREELKEEEKKRKLEGGDLQGQMEREWRKLAGGEGSSVSNERRQRKECIEGDGGGRWNARRGREKKNGSLQGGYHKRLKSSDRFTSTWLPHLGPCVRALRWLLGELIVSVTHSHCPLPSSQFPFFFLIVSRCASTRFAEPVAFFVCQAPSEIRNRGQNGQLFKRKTMKEHINFWGRIL